MPAYAGMTAVFLVTGLLFSFNANAEEGKRYNFNTHRHAVEHETSPDETPPSPAEETAKAEVPASEPAPKVVDGVYNPNGTVSPKAVPTSGTHLTRAQYKDKAERLVRFFIGSCFKFYGRNDDMIKFLDDSFQRLDTDRKAVFAPVINGTITTQYWDIALNDNFYVLAKDTSSGKCDVIAKDGASTAIHRELKAVMDGLRITKIVDTKTDYEKIRNLNKEVSIVNILGHPLEKELGAVATTQIKETGDNMAAILTLFTVPQETVEIK